MFKLKYSFSANLSQIKGIQKPNSKKKGIKKLKGFQKPNLITSSTNLPGRKMFVWLQSPMSVILAV